MTTYFCGKHKETVVEARGNSYYCPECKTVPGTIKPAPEPASILQVFAFHGDDIQKVYEQLNNFLAELPAFEITVPLEQVHSITKFYPDHGTTSTTIEVFLYIGGPEPKEASQIKEVHRAILRGPERKVPADFDPFLDSDDLP